MLRVYHGGELHWPAESLWATSDWEYAAAFAQLHDGPLWMLTLDVSDGEVLDLTDCGLEVSTVVTDLMFAGIFATTQAGDERQPMIVVRRVSPDAIRAAGYRGPAARVDQLGSGERHAESVYVVDPTAILDREVLPLPDRNFQFPDGREPKHRGAGSVCPTLR
jgi:hypothetical protein